MDEVRVQVELGSRSFTPVARDDFPVSDEFVSANNLKLSSYHNTAELRFRCQAAAIFLQQGRNNEKFITHPREPAGLPPYLIVHNRWFYLIDLLASLLLMSLALVENPAHVFEIPVWLHAVIELMCLFLIALELGMKIRWLGLHQSVRHIRTMMKAFVLAVMLIEVFVLFGRGQVHIRVTRALRPIFLVDNYYLYGVRRFLRQVLYTLPQVLEILFSLLLVMFVFSILGYFLFRSNNDAYFGSPSLSFVSLFVLLTSANFPDVMMPSYSACRWNALFFVVYLCLEMYFVMNLLLAVVYDSFTSNERDKFRKLYLHRRQGCQRAFTLLVCKDDPDHIKIDQFCTLMHYYKRSSSLRDTFLIFKALNLSKTGRLSIDEFYSIYNIAECRWKCKDDDFLAWFSTLPKPLRVIFEGVRFVVNTRCFEYFFYVVMLADGAWFMAETYLHEMEIPSTHMIRGAYHLPSGLFVAAFGCEALLKLVAFGFREYFSSGWNIFEFGITAFACLGFLGSIQDGHAFSYLIVLRCIGFVKLMAKFRQTYQDIFCTVRILIPRLISTAITFLLVYYFFGILGMEAFCCSSLKNCCQNSTIEDQYKFSNESGSQQGYYFLNNFDNIAYASVTLFELTVVNNWNIIMEGYAISRGAWTRVYFMAFYVVTMVVLTIVVAFIIEAFLFRLQCRRNLKESDVYEEDTACFEVHVVVNQTTMDVLCSKGDSISEEEMRSVATQQFVFEVYNIQTDKEEWTRMVGRRGKNRFDLSSQLYAQNLPGWIAEDERAMGVATSGSTEFRRLEEDTHLIE